MAVKIGTDSSNHCLGIILRNFLNQSFASHMTENLYTCIEVNNKWVKITKNEFSLKFGT